MTKTFFLIIICVISFSVANIYGQGKDVKEFEGVITLHNIPQK